MPRPSRAATSRRCGSATCSACPRASRPSRRARRIEPWTKTFLAHPVPFKPGTHFLYNTSATYMLSAIVQKATGETVLDYLRPRLFEPLGIEHPTWETSPQGISTGGFGLSIRTEDIARFGQLYLQKGKWQGKQLVPEAWIEAATARQTSNGSNPEERLGPGLRLPVLALPPRRLPGRRSVRAVLHRAARAGCGDRHHQRREGHAGRPEPGLGQAPAGHEARRRCRPTMRPGRNSNRR